MAVVDKMNARNNKRDTILKPSRLQQKTLFDLFPRSKQQGPPKVELPNKKEPCKSPSTSAMEPNSKSRPPLPNGAPASKDQGGRATNPDEVNSAIIVPSPTQSIHVIEIDDDDVPSLTVKTRFTTPVRGEQDTTREGFTRAAPIIIEESPIKADNQPSQGLKRMHSFFKPKPQRAPYAKRSIPANPPDAPFPSRDMQHVRGHQTTFETIPCAYRISRISGSTRFDPHFGAYSFLKETDIDIYDDSNYPYVLRSSDITKITNHLTTIPDTHKIHHPAIARAVHYTLSQMKEPSTYSTWTDKWRPRCAHEVLGNESSAIYLRDWLRALELHFQNDPAIGQRNPSKGSKRNLKRNKRPHVVREVQKERRKRRRINSSDDENDWIVYDEEDIEGAYEDDVGGDLGDELEQLLHQANSFLGASSKNKFRQETEQLHNTILLVGPPGSGKTACVYACAEELGWEVFEVYPGIGKRSGSNLDYLIGQVGKNHLIHGTINQRQGSPVTLDDCKEGTQKEELDSLNSENESGGSGPVSEGHGSSYDEIDCSSADSFPKSKSLPQSVVLLEEVDILFKEDVNFWPAVIQFIKDCKRPVICTCNDISLVPVLELPLQTVLTLDVCPAPVAASYLQAVSCAEGYIMERETIMGVYGNIEETFGNYTITAPDLRRAIHALQMWCVTGTSNQSCKLVSATEETPRTGTQAADEERIIATGDSVVVNEMALQGQTEDTDRRWLNHIELFSYLDGNLTQNSNGMQDEIDLVLEKTSDDEEVGHKMVYDLKDERERSRFGFQDREKEIELSAIRLARGKVMAGVTRGPGSTKNDSYEIQTSGGTRMEIEAQTREVIGEVCPHIVGGIGEYVHLDYMPWIRRIVEMDDEQEEEYRQREGKGRKTRNSGGRYVRSIELSKGGRSGVEKTSWSGRVVD